MYICIYLLWLTDQRLRKEYTDIHTYRICIHINTFMYICIIYHICVYVYTCSSRFRRDSRTTGTYMIYVYIYVCMWMPAPADLEEILELLAHI